MFFLTFEDIISIDNLLEAWKEFASGKRNKTDVQAFSLHLMDNLTKLSQELADFSYGHGSYQAFNIADPKPRNLHKASIKDRLLHHAIYRKLYPLFDSRFIYDSYSCRLNKGTHKAINRFKRFGYKVSKNSYAACYVLKCDIKKFFASINQAIILKILGENLANKDVIWLLEKVVVSFDSGTKGIGLPLGNLTSQLFVNVYMDVFDQYVKHVLKEKYYIRYADDFVIMSSDRNHLNMLLPNIRAFLWSNLRLKLHPNKVYIKTLTSGVDFLGWVHFFDHRVLRTSTKKRAFKRTKENPVRQTIASYLGLLKHGNTHKIRQNILKQYYLCKHKKEPRNR